MFFSQISAKIRSNFPQNSHKIRENNNLFNFELFSTKVIQKMGQKIENNVILDEPEVDSYSTEDPIGTEELRIQINDSKVLDSMQMDRSKRKKRKRRRRNRKTNSQIRRQIQTKQIQTRDPNIETIFCFDSDLEFLEKNLFFDYFFCKSEPKSDHVINEHVMSETNSEIMRANEKWNQYYSNSSNCLDCCRVRESDKKVTFSECKPSVKVLRVWDFAHRSARIGREWEQMARDRQRFRNKCLQIENKIGFIFDPKHRQQVFNSRFNCF